MIEITFILPTLNRKEWLLRAIRSCLKTETAWFIPHVLIIDSQSKDGTAAAVQNEFSKNPRVRLLQNNPSDRFMKTCFIGVANLKTEWATFMYDDDILSPFWSILALSIVEKTGTFSSGYGITHDVRSEFKFHRPNSANLFSKEAVLSAYFDIFLEFKNALPMSPICCMIESKKLRQWVPLVQEFCSKTPLRDYYMMQRNIGPDLMIYLLGIFESRANIAVVKEPIAQFSEHSNSMSILAIGPDLDIGYWLAKIWAFENLNTYHLSHLRTNFGAYLLFFGIKMGIYSLRFCRWSDTWQIILEMVQILKVCLFLGNPIKLIIYIVRLFIRAIRQKMKT